MNFMSQRLVILAACAALSAPVAAQAQTYAAASPPPLYPYELQPGQPYAVQVAPNTYVIHRPSRMRDYPYVAPAAQPRRASRPAPRNNPALIEELRQQGTKKTKKTVKIETRGGMKRDVVHTTKIVRGPPVVVERRRYVDDPPQVIERYVTEAPDGSLQPVAQPPSPARRGKLEARGVLPPPSPPPSSAKPGKDEKRVIRADAEVTILGPDRMSIRLFRKGSGPKASAEQ